MPKPTKKECDYGVDCESGDQIRVCDEGHEICSSDAVPPGYEDNFDRVGDEIRETFGSYKKEFCPVCQSNGEDNRLKQGVIAYIR